jgi:hypothetical protein
MFKISLLALALVNLPLLADTICEFTRGNTSYEIIGPDDFLSVKSAQLSMYSFTDTDRIKSYGPKIEATIVPLVITLSEDRESSTRLERCYGKRRITFDAKFKIDTGTAVYEQSMLCKKWVQ